ncbi:SDR family NAD(P)-dependent oxidoreductase [Paenibacillus xylaniclasticus]|jgi:Short-chain alcohol dehydrogenase of unknown specificity|uniref:SDR family NAD(P)-dependent oxidoreductase n=1 Tax=Paenibacillus xylaniclasticus TaxID=588083 RepID=UPI000FD8F3A9|nr:MULTISPECIES: SDR family NAD(P)-dependent oxidoreductase [Paenibacillus]GFN33214.1 hypothetical protein PCURB6_34740 [Paenibacillus curdlanolyticus]
MKKVGLITGANRGLGFETDRQLGSLGCTVLLGARNKEKGEEAAAKLQAHNFTFAFQLTLNNNQTALNL